MKYKNVKLLLLGVLMIGISLAINSQAPNAVSFAQQQSVETAEYSCPMHPEVKSKTGGSCPKCGMTLKRVSKPDVAAAETAEATGSGTHFPNVELITQDGKKVRFYDDLIKGKVVALELIYTTCKYNCPLETARMVQLQKVLGDHMGKDVFFYSITIDPEHDTPEVLREYAAKYHVGPGWTFLTGKVADIKLISKKLGLDKLPNGNDPDGHMPSLLIGNETTGIWMRNSALDNTKFMALKIEQMIGYGAKADIVAVKKTDSTELNIDKGAYIFATRCAACHTIGNGDKIGPDLLGVTNVRDRAWLARIISEPDKMIDEKDPLTIALFQKYKGIRMPRLGLNQVDVNTLIEFMKIQTASLNNKGKAQTQN